MNYSHTFFFVKKKFDGRRDPPLVRDASFITALASQSIYSYKMKRVKVKAGAIYIRKIDTPGIVKNILTNYLQCI